MLDYPLIDNRFIWKRKSAGEYEVYDYIVEESTTVSNRIAKFAKKLDGKTDPYAIAPDISADEVDQMLKLLDENGMLRYSKTAGKSFGTIYRTIWFPKNTSFSRKVSKVLNLLLKLLWLPILLIGTWFFVSKDWYSYQSFMTEGTLLGLLTSVFMHELAHACAVMSCGGRVCEMGIMIRNFIPGAYILTNAKQLKRRSDRIQIYSAGVEMNFFLFGLFLIFGYFSQDIFSLFLFAGVINFFFGATNLFLIKGVDGMSIISECLGIDDAVQHAANIIFNRKKRSAVLSIGINGKITIICCAVILLLQIGLPLIVLSNVTGVLLWLT